MKTVKKQDRPGDLRFYCSACLGATEATQEDPASPLKCNVHPKIHVIVMREMLRPNGHPYYVSIEKEAKVR